MNSLFGPKNNNRFAPENSKVDAVEFNSTETKESNGGIHSFSDFGYKDGRLSQGVSDGEPREKAYIRDILDTPITITGVHERNSKMSAGGTYLTIEFEKDDTKYYCNTSGQTIKKQLEDRVGVTYPFTATIKEISKKDNPNLKYYKLT